MGAHAAEHRAARVVALAVVTALVERACVVPLRLPPQGACAKPLVRWAATLLVEGLMRPVRLAFTTAATVSAEAVLRASWCPTFAAQLRAVFAQMTPAAGNVLVGAQLVARR